MVLGLDNTTEILIFSSVALWYLFRTTNKRATCNLPPSASILNNFPILGYIPFVNLQTFHEDVAKLGPIVRYKLGPDDVIIVNDFDLIKEVSTRDEFQDRPQNFLFRLLGNAQILINWSGKLWRSQRNFSLRALRTLGFGKSKFEGKIHDEMKYMMELMDKDTNQNGIQIKRFVGPSVSNVIMLMTIGQRHDFDHPIRQKIDSLFLQDRSNSFFSFYSCASHFTSTLRFLLGLVPDFLSVDMKEFVSYLPNLLTKITHEKMQVVDKMNDYELNEPGENFIDSYLKHMKLLQSSTDEANLEEKQYFTEDNGRANAQAFFAAGSATTKDSIEWALALLAVHRDVQEEIFEEIRKVVGSRLISINDKPDLPITESTIQEVMRFASQVPVNIPHCASRDTKLGGYDIPKGTHIQTNIYNVHNDTRYWNEPEKFKHDRFLSDDKTKCIKRDHLMPFGFGKRSCPGESMAVLEIFLYTATLVQKYKISPDNKEKVIDPFVNGLSRNVNRDLRLKFIPRSQE